MQFSPQEMQNMNINSVLVFVLSVCIFISLGSQALADCNLYQGQWVSDQTYPLYDSTQCPYIRREFDCLKYGRPDREYLKYRWQPSGCDLPRFEGIYFLNRMRGKKIMFVGDSISANSWQSLLCILHAAVGGNNVEKGAHQPVSYVTFKDYNLTISVYLTHYLVDIVKTKIGKVMFLDSIKYGGKIWKEQDVLIFNSWLWWGRADARKGWKYYSYDRQIIRHMNYMTAYTKALATWANWVNTEVDPSKQKVFFQGMTPMHYHGKSWDNPSATNCGQETTPFNGTVYPDGEPKPLQILKETLSTTKQVELLDITTLSQYRKDAHPGKYSGYHGMDCTHWCISGVPDTWNELISAHLV